LRFFWTRDTHTDINLWFSRGPLNRPIKYVAELDWPVVSLAKQIQRRYARERTHLMMDRSASVQKEALNHIQRSGSQLLENAKTKALSDGRVDPVENCVCPGTFNPRRTALGK
jgi:hypothetical protein